MPKPLQLFATLPYSFKEKKYPTTFGLIDASEIFIETPNDLQLQSLSCSNYMYNTTMLPSFLFIVLQMALFHLFLLSILSLSQSLSLLGCQDC